MEITQELITELRAAGSKEAFAGILAENKIEMTAEEVDGWYQHESKIAEMSEDELAQVTGGWSARTPSTHPGPSIKCDHRELGTCSVPDSVCSGIAIYPENEERYGAVNAYARSCPKMVNNYKPEAHNFLNL